MADTRALTVIKVDGGYLLQLEADGRSTYCGWRRKWHRDPEMSAPYLDERMAHHDLARYELGEWR